MPAENVDEVSRLREDSELLKLLQEVAAVANEADDLQQVLQFTLDKVCEYTGWPVGHAYWLTDPDEKHMISSRLWYCAEEASYADFREITEQTTFDAEEWLGEIVAGKEKGSLWEFTAQPYWHHRDTESAGFMAGYALPVLAGGRVRAVLEFYALERKESDEPFVEAMRFVATQLAHVFERQDAQWPCWPANVVSGPFSTRPSSSWPSASLMGRLSKPTRPL